MAEGITELWDGLIAAGADARRSWQDGNSEKAVDELRRVLSFASKLHQRMGAFVEFERDAKWKAAVDRAISAKNKPELAGQMTITDAVKNVQKKSASRRRKV